MAMPLPSGRTGQALALGLLLLTLATLWLGLAAPLLDGFDERAGTLRHQQALAARMERLAGTLPALSAKGAGTAAPETDDDALLPGGSDPLAAAALQQKLDAMAGAARVRIASEEILPAQPAEAFRAIGVRVTANAPYAALMALLRALADSDVPMLVDDLAVRGTARGRDPDPHAEHPVDASFIVTAYRRATAGGGGS